ncbi:hypothetical protein PILCRDRAFT_232410 [Piloderma croceum F 1598]|uniref:Uncharacterized protein n=1 Tax=Piloderma croceum (strain F 1598) TaxID=765440 RepID=A0A0C3BQ59_PILCF|nr:hypothetical protein PILCRDRAFT_232410 [Piloderma croceum F 1598]
MLEAFTGSRLTRRSTLQPLQITRSRTRHALMVSGTSRRLKPELDSSCLVCHCAQHLTRSSRDGS